MSSSSRNKKNDWLAALTLKTTKYGSIRPTANNLKQIIANHPDLAGTIRFDEFADRIIATRPIYGAGFGRYPRPWIDRDTADLQVKLDAELDIEPPSMEALDRAVDAVARDPKNRSNEIVDALQALAKRKAGKRSPAFRQIAEAMHVAEPDGIASTMLRRWMIGAAARALEPGVKFDSMLILIGPRHGCGKSSFCRNLVSAITSPRYYIDSPASVSSKDAVILMRDAWIWEWSELDNIAGATLERVKAFLSSAVDEYREPYARRCVQAPRHTAIIGTTNQEDVLRDLTGSRRFWVIRACARNEPKFSRITVGMIRDAWAAAASEAIAYLASDRVGLPPWVMTPDEEAAAANIASEATVADPWLDILADRLAEVPAEEAAVGVPAETLYGWLGIAPADRTLSSAQRIGRAMIALGWRRYGQRCRGSARYVR